MIEARRTLDAIELCLAGREQAGDETVLGAVELLVAGGFLVREPLKDEAPKMVTRVGFDERIVELVKLILDDMSAATNRDLAADGDVGDEEGTVWKRIEEVARDLREHPSFAFFKAVEGRVD